MNYTNFQKYPLSILGINESYDEELTAIEEAVVNEIGYSGVIEDLAVCLPYFVYFKFIESVQSEVTTKGEMSQVAEFSIQSYDAQIRAWNMGAKILRQLCIDKFTTASEIYKSKISVL